MLPCCGELSANTYCPADQLLNTLRPSAHWTNQVSPLALPPRFRLLLADVDAGSDTPSLVGKVLKWRKENVEDGEFPITDFDKL